MTTKYRHTLNAIVTGIYENIKNDFPSDHAIEISEQMIFADHPDWNPDSEDENGEDGEDGDLDETIITVSKSHDPILYCIVSFWMRDNNLSANINFYTKCYQLDESTTVNLVDPNSLLNLEYWLITEITDGIKRGKSGRTRKRIPKISRPIPKT